MLMVNGLDSMKLKTFFHSHDYCCYGFSLKTSELFHEHTWNYGGNNMLHIEILQRCPVSVI